MFCSCFCERCFVQYSRIFGLLENSRNTRAYCEFFVPVFFRFSMFFGCFVEILQYCKTLAKHRKTPAKHHKTPTKHHKTHLLTKQPEFANKPALAPAGATALTRASSCTRMTSLGQDLLQRALWVGPEASKMRKSPYLRLLFSAPSPPYYH